MSQKKTANETITEAYVNQVSRKNTPKQFSTPSGIDNALLAMGVTASDFSTAQKNALLVIAVLVQAYKIKSVEEAEEQVGHGLLDSALLRDTFNLSEE